MGHCGRCGDTLHAEVDEETTHRQALPMMQPPLGGYSTSAVQTSGSETAELPHDVRVVLIGIDAVAQTPETSSSRLHYHRPALDELAASIRQHGLLQPILVRPAADEETRNDTLRNSDSPQPAYVVVAGNRRLRAARQAGLASVPCIIRVTDADGAFILNVVENLQRRELSGRERVRALLLLAALTDESGRTFGVREISRRTGLATGTISTWLRIHRSPMLEAALEDERVDIGRAMILVSAPDEDLPQLIERARSLSQQDLAGQVGAAKRATCVQGAADMSADERHARAAYQALLLVAHVPEPVRQALVCVQQRLNELLT
jgi:ParB family chromosome partitioning protein